MRSTVLCDLDGGPSAQQRSISLGLRAGDIREALFVSHSRPVHSPRSSANVSRLLRQAYKRHQKGQFSGAARLYAAVLAQQPNNFDALHLLGLLNYQQGRLGEALRYIAAALRSNARSVEGLANHGLVLHALGRYEDAVTSYDQALALKPHAPEIHNGRGNALTQLGRHQDALDSFDRALAIRPDYLLAAYNRGTCLFESGRAEEALADFDRALAIDPHHVETLGNRGNALFKLNRIEEALTAYAAALAISPDHPRLLHNRAHALRQAGRPAEALTTITTAMDSGGADPEIRYEHALIQLTLGAFRAGWGSYEWRWQTREFAPQRRDFRQPLWLGEEPLAGKTILLHAEQGFGDTIQFARYLSVVANLDARVILEVQAELHTLMRGLDAVSTVVARGEPLPQFELQCPLASLPLACKTEIATIPASVPYIAVSQDRVAVWRKRLPPRPLLVGLAWAGRPTHPNDRNRSLAFERLTPLFAASAVCFVSLQYDVGSDDDSILRQHPDVLRLGQQVKDFADTAAIISLLDVVVSVDTAIAHLAGALGKPVFLMLPYAADFRWLVGRQDSPWYPTAQLFRQPRFGDWKTVVTQVGEALDAYRTRAVEQPTAAN
jgi:tetratricopeptide (TPR) repeat protein